MGVAMRTAELTALASAVDVLNDLHRPPLEQVSPAAASIRDQALDDEVVPTWRDLGYAVAGLVAFYVLYVGVWVVFGGAA